MAVKSLFFVALIIKFVWSIDNGLGVNPPMGWRSWNCYHGNIDQPLIEKVIDAMLDTSRQVNGKAMSYVQLGYGEVGVDDNWQLCDSTGHYFHNNTAPNGWANINTQRFPDLSGLVSYAHGKGVKIGWYMNNCICSEHEDYPANEVNDVAFLRKYDFDGIKLDGCGTSHNISNWQHLINTTGSKPLLTENCHNQPNYANETWCPMNFFRSSGDINPDYTHIIGQNLQSVIPYSKYPGPAITRQGCFAYPDMLEVGNIKPTLNATAYSQDRTHFGAWCTVSAPLVIGYDVTNGNTTDAVWDILTNTEAIAVSQTWAGHPGTLLNQSSESYWYTYPPHIQKQVKEDNQKYGGIYANQSTEGVSLAAYQIWGKPQNNGAWAVLIMNNNGNQTVDITLEFSVIPGLNPNNVKLRSIWDRKDLGTFSNSYTAKGILAFDSEFLMVTPSS